MTEAMAQKILEKLNRIESLLVRIIPQVTELTEEDVLGIVKEGRKEYRAGKLENFDDFIKREYPQYVNKKSKAL
jgi:flavodoxin